MGVWIGRDRSSMWVGRVSTVGTLCDVWGGCHGGGAKPRCRRGILSAHVRPDELHAGSAAGLDALISRSGNTRDASVSSVGETVSDGPGGSCGQVRR